MVWQIFCRWVAVGVLALLLPQAVAAQDTGRIVGQIVDATSGEPLPGASVGLRDTNRGQATDRDGRFSFERLSPGTYALRASFVSFASRSQELTVEAGETTTVTLALSPTALDLPDVVVTDSRRPRAAAEVYRPTSVVTGPELQRRLSSTVPATLNRVPGFSAQYNGPGATRPSIRGMSGDRVLMLEDGQRTGDLYQTTADHGVMVEPLTAERMEVIRGPAGLLYSAQALGGVVNVIRNDIPREQPAQLTGTFSSQLESMNEGRAAGLTVTGPAGPLALRAELSGRGAGDTRTPQGDLPSTGLASYNGSLGASYLPSWGLVGASYRFYDNVYGVPGEFNGELIEGGHPGGVDIEAIRHVGRFRAAYAQPLWVFSTIELDANLTRYVHDEIELRRDGQEDILGTRFRQTSGEVNLVARHQHDLRDLRTEGVVGISYTGRSLGAGGLSPGTRSGDTWNLAAYGYEDLNLSPVRLQVGARVDVQRRTPRSQADIRVRSSEGERIIKPVTERSFTGFSGSVAALYDVAPAWTMGARIARSYRAPGLEELYSDGPHLADFSFDIGDPSLDPETGLGLDIFLRTDYGRFRSELTGFFNRVEGYIFTRNTGLTVLIDRTGDFGRVTPVFENTGRDADFWGAEGSTQLEVLPSIVIDATASYVRATQRQSNSPLPRIPPLHGSAEVRYAGQRFFGSVGIDAAATQGRVPDLVTVDGNDRRPEQPTDGYHTAYAELGLRLTTRGTFHRLSLRGHNITDATWRNHTSRIKDVAPQPGRNLVLTYRVEF